MSGSGPAPNSPDTFRRRRLSVSDLDTSEFDASGGAKSPEAPAWLRPRLVSMR